MWSDTIFGGNPDKAKLLYLAKCSEALYAGTLSAVYGGSNLRQIDSLGGYPVMAWDYQGQPLVCLPGTDGVVDWGLQYGGYLVPYPADVGAWNSFNATNAAFIYDDLPSGDVLLFGHSAGGATAQMLGWMRRKLNAGIAGVVTFGCPRAVSQAAAAASGWPPTVNIVTYYDPVPKFPANVKGVGLSWQIPKSDTAWLLGTNGDLTATNIGAASVTVIPLAFLSATSTWHSISTYVQCLSGSLSNGQPPIGGNVLQTYRVMWQAVLFNQSVQNILHYRILDTNTALDIATEIRRLWRLYIKPMTSASLRVLYYDVSKISGTVSNGGSPPSNLFRYSEKARLPGTDLDVGDDVGDCFPSYVAAGANKSVGEWRLGAPGAQPPVTGQFKLTRGSIRLSGVDEDRNDATDNNRIKVGDITNYQNAFNGLMKVLPGSGNPTAGNMCVVTTSIEGIPIVTGTPPVTGYYFAYVNSLTVNPFLTTQNSRKASVSRLG